MGRLMVGSSILPTRNPIQQHDNPGDHSDNTEERKRVHHGSSTPAIAIVAPNKTSHTAPPAATSIHENGRSVRA
jgi:hypothetical protein